MNLGQGRGDLVAVVIVVAIIDVRGCVLGVDNVGVLCRVRCQKGKKKKRKRKDKYKDK